ncbi:MAG: 4Fe-4S binding protein [Muribaculaceae bacterium]|nr:4Fe-4S binding protein [Muribaculaceae bacterium]
MPIKNRHIVKALRVAVQLISLCFITWCLMAAPSAVVLACKARVEHWMIVPMTILGSVAVLGFWLAITLVFGRVYCSTVCPIGTIQDVGECIGKLIFKDKVYRYQPPGPAYARVAMWCLFIMAALFDSLAVTWTLIPFLQLSPPDSYSYIVQTAGYIAGWNPPVAFRIMISAGINLLFLLGMGALRGRSVCNLLCPVGGCLGTLNHFAILQFDIDTDRCTHCRKCEYVCKTNCINSDHGTVDPGRCVVCFNCVSVCPDNAIRYTTHRHQLQLPLMQPIKRRATSLNLTSNSQIDNK